MKFNADQGQGQTHAMKQHDEYPEQGQITPAARASMDDVLRYGNIFYTNTSVKDFATITSITRINTAVQEHLK